MISIEMNFCLAEEGMIATPALPNSLTGQENANLNEIGWSRAPLPTPTEAK